MYFYVDDVDSEFKDVLVLMVLFDWVVERFVWEFEIVSEEFCEVFV